MATSGYNEADTRAKLIDPALHASQWIELVKDEQRVYHVRIANLPSKEEADALAGRLRGQHGVTDPKVST